eukprot:gene15293-biopygen688
MRRCHGRARPPAAPPTVGGGWCGAAAHAGAELELSASSGDDRPAAPGVRAHSLCGWGMGHDGAAFVRIRPGGPSTTRPRCPPAFHAPWGGASGRPWNWAEGGSCSPFRSLATTHHYTPAERVCSRPCRGQALPPLWAGRRSGGVGGARGAVPRRRVRREGWQAGSCAAVGGVCFSSLGAGKPLFGHGTKGHERDGGLAAAGPPGRGDSWYSTPS